MSRKDVVRIPDGYKVVDACVPFGDPVLWLSSGSSHFVLMEGVSGPSFDKIVDWKTLAYNSAFHFYGCDFVGNRGGEVFFCTALAHYASGGSGQSKTAIFTEFGPYVKIKRWDGGVIGTRDDGKKVVITSSRDKTWGLGPYDQVLRTWLDGLAGSVRFHLLVVSGSELQHIVDYH